MNKLPLVSVIVPTLNAAGTLERCLLSIRHQEYRKIELIVVDNHSVDDTRRLAKLYADKVYVHGVERSAQVNYGVKKSKGELVYKVDADFVLEKGVIAEAVAKINDGDDAVVVHNSPDCSISWIAKIRKFEVDMYKYDLDHSSARFLRKTVYQAIGGFDESMTAGEDYDLQNKLNRFGYKTGFIEAEALHIGEPKYLWPHLKKYYMYGKDFINYKHKNQKEATKQLSFFRGVYLRNWRRFVAHPLLAAAFVIYNGLKFTAGGLGLLVAKMKTHNGGFGAWGKYGKKN